MAWKMGMKFMTGLSLAAGLVMGTVADADAQRPRGGGIGYSAPANPGFDESYTATRVILYRDDKGGISGTIEGFSDFDESLNTYYTGSRKNTAIKLGFQENLSGPVLSKADIRLRDVKIQYLDSETNMASFEATAIASRANSNVASMLNVSGDPFAKTESYNVRSTYFHGNNVEVIINNAARGIDAIPARNRIQSETENKGVTVNLKGIERLISLSDDPNSRRVFERSSTTAGTTLFSNDLVKPGFPPPRDRQPVTPPRDRGPRPTRN